MKANLLLLVVANLMGIQALPPSESTTRAEIVGADLTYLRGQAVDYAGQDRRKMRVKRLTMFKKPAKVAREKQIGKARRWDVRRLIFHLENLQTEPDSAHKASVNEKMDYIFGMGIEEVLPLIELKKDLYNSDELELLDFLKQVNDEDAPTSSPTSGPTHTPTQFPTGGPTIGPTNAPTGGPTQGPTDGPSSSPTSGPTKVPTNEPTNGPTTVPTGAPTDTPTNGPTYGPTVTFSPTFSPTSRPTSGPTRDPTSGPTYFPTSDPTSAPTETPTQSIAPSSTPTDGPTMGPTSAPSHVGSTEGPTYIPTNGPTETPTNSPTGSPTSTPTSGPTSTLNFIGNRAMGYYELTECQGGKVNLVNVYDQESCSTLLTNVCSSKDCDYDSDCYFGLVCGKRSLNDTYVPGCAGNATEIGDGTHDFCIKPPTANTLVIVADYDESDGGSWPLGECEADCYNDDDCEGELECWVPFDEDKGIPGCIGSGDEEYGYCYNAANR